MRKPILILAAVQALVLAGCSEDPTEQNALVAALPLADVIVRDTVITATGGESVLTPIPMNGPLNMLGRSEGYAASMALQFYPSLFPARDTVLVLAASLRMHAVSWMGDSAGPLGFTVHRIDRSWNQATLTSDSVLSGFYNATVERGSYTGGAAADSHTVTVSLDTAMVREWLATATGTTDTKYGVVLVPSFSTRIIRGFIGFDSVSDSLRPTLQIVAVNLAGTARDTSRFTLGTDTFFGALDMFAPDPSLMIVQAGLPVRSTLTFDMTGIPRGAIINMAEMLFQRDPGASRLTKFSGDSLVTGHLLLAEADLTLFESDRTSPNGKRKDSTANTVSFDLRHAAQSWVRGPNYGLLLRASSATEFSSADRHAFHSPRAADPSMRPRLRLIYSIKKL